MAAAAPFFAYLEQLRELQGEPLVSFLNGDRNFPQTERVTKVFRTEAATFAPGDAEPDAARFSGLVCTEIKELRGDTMSVEVYRKYETIPGPVTTSLEWASGGLRNKITEQEVAPSTGLVGGEFVSAERLEGDTAQKSKRTKTTLVKADGTTFAGGDLAIITQEIRDGRLECTLYIDRFPIDPLTYTLPIEGTAWPATAPVGQVLESKRHPVDGSPRDIAEVTYIRALPILRVDQPEIPFTFPGIFVQNREWWNLDNIPGPLRRPYIGEDLDVWIIRPKSLSNRGRRIKFYTYGPGSDPGNIHSTVRSTGNFFLPETYGVTTPGASSKTYRGYIEPNMIHQAFTAFYRDANGDLVEVENFPSSTPSSYDPRSVVVAHTSSEKWEHGGRVYENIIEQVSELTPPEFFPPIYVTIPLYATSPVEIARDGQLFGPTGFGVDEPVPLVFSSDGADTRIVRIIGRNRLKVPTNEIPFHIEEIILDGSASVSTLTSWYKIFQITLSAPDAARTVGAYVGGIPAIGSILATTSAPLVDADTLTLTHGSDVRVFTFYQPHRIAIQCDTKANIGGTGRYITLYDQYGLVVFWFKTVAEVAPVVGGAVRYVMVDVHAYSTAADMFTVLSNAIFLDRAGALGVADPAGDPQFFVTHGGSNILVVNDRYLGTRTATGTGGGAFGGAWGFVGPDTGGAVAAAANQIRWVPDITYSVLGVTVTADLLNNTAIAETLGDVATAIADGSAGPATTALSYVADIGVSTPDSIDLTVQVTDTVDSAFSFAKSCANPAALTLVNPSGGGFSDYVLASFAPTKTEAFIPIQFNDSALNQIGFPARVTVTSDPVALGGRSASLYIATGPRFYEAGYPAFPVSVTYEVSYDGTTWEASGESTIAINNGEPKNHAIPATHTYSTGAHTGLLAINYARVTFANLANKNRSIFAFINLLIVT